MISLLFLVFKLIVIFNALGVILSKNPVHSVLFLVLVFINSAFLLIFLEADFMALILVVVYVGAIAILFLFICNDA
jgi:NADH-quinone oxidoreductase subunit J